MRDAANGLQAQQGALDLVVIDTNVLLDCFVFADKRALALQLMLRKGHIRWLATQSMREEYARVLDYPAIKGWLKQHATARLEDEVPYTDIFEHYALIMPFAPKSGLLCDDPDDQKFIDLAVQYRAVLLSKDKAVLKLGRRLVALGVVVAQQFKPQVFGSQDPEEYGLQP